MRHKLPPRRKTTFSSSLKLRSALLTVLLLSPWVGALLAVPGDASATSIGLPPGYNTCYEQYSVVGWIQVISHGEGGGGISTPTTSCLQDGWTSYDDVLYVIVSPSINAPTAAYVVIEQYTPGTVTVYQNETARNGTTVLVPVQVPVRMDPYWSNATFTVYPATQTGVIMSLNYSADGNPMVVAVGGTSYQTILAVEVDRTVGNVLAGLQKEAKRNPRRYGRLLAQAERDFRDLRDSAHFFPNKRELYQLGIDAYPIALTNLTGGYGGGHCMTAAIERS